MNKFELLASSWLNAFASIMLYLWYRSDFHIVFFDTLSIKTVACAAAISFLPVIRNWFNKNYTLYGLKNTTKTNTENEKK